MKTIIPRATQILLENTYRHLGLWVFPGQRHQGVRADLYVIACSWVELPVRLRIAVCVKGNTHAITGVLYIKEIHDDKIIGKEGGYASAAGCNAATVSSIGISILTRIGALTALSAPTGEWRGSERDWPAGDVRP